MKFSQFKLLVDMMFTPDEQGGRSRSAMTARMSVR